MKTQYYTATSLDGFIAGPDHSLDWLMQFGEPEGDHYEQFIRDVGAVAMGSSTYQWILDNHVHANADKPAPWPYEQPSWVFTSRTLPTVPNADIRFVEGDVEPVYAQIANAAGDRNLWIVGGGDLVGQFHDRGLLDELIVTVAPVTLGAGAPLLPRAITSPPLRLVSARAHGDTFAALRYEVVR
jgi:dihydrofolate reductase